MSAFMPYHIARMRGLDVRYDLDANMMRALQYLEDYQMGVKDKDDLGRLIRTSARVRASVVETRDNLLHIMAESPWEVNDCDALILNCREILKIAEQLPLGFFPLFKIPREIRDMVYEQYIAQSLGPDKGVHPVAKLTNCQCADVFTTIGNHLPFHLARVSKLVSEEFLSYFYRRQKIQFACTCDLEVHLTNNQILFLVVEHIKFHWCGDRAPEAFRKLKECERLSHLEVRISRATTARLTPREEMMARYFPGRRQGVISVALGITELLEIRGLSIVDVNHIPKSRGWRRTNRDRDNLNTLLKDFLLQPRVVKEE